MGDEEGTAGWVIYVADCHGGESELLVDLELRTWNSLWNFFCLLLDTYVYMQLLSAVGQ